MATAMNPNERKPAPNVSVEEDIWGSERQELLTQYAPECIAPKPDRRRKRQLKSQFVAYFGDPAEPVERRINKGWEAVVDKNGKQVTHNGDPLYRMKRENYERKVLDPPNKRSHRIVKDSLLAHDSDARSAGAFPVDDRGREMEYEEAAQ